MQIVSIQVVAVSQIQHLSGVASTMMQSCKYYSLTVHSTKKIRLEMAVWTKITQL